MYAFYFGYGKSKSFSKWRNFLFYPRMIYSSYKMPERRFVFRRIVFHIAWASLALAMMQAAAMAVCRRRRKRDGGSELPAGTSASDEAGF
jgi:hypothetical protein